MSTKSLDIFHVWTSIHSHYQVKTDLETLKKIARSPKYQGGVFSWTRISLTPLAKIVPNLEEILSE